jgi:hypothetical protein
MIEKIEPNIIFFGNFISFDWITESLELVQFKFQDTMKSIFFLSFLILCNLKFTQSFNVAQNEKSWQRIQTDLRINGTNDTGTVAFSTSSKKIRGKVTCSNSCDIYLLDFLQFNNVTSFSL